jgi:hypothetical protein
VTQTEANQAAKKRRYSQAELDAAIETTKIQVAKRCAEIALETRVLRRAERRYLADPDNVLQFVSCAYREAAYQIRKEFGIPEPARAGDGDNTDG